MQQMEATGKTAVLVGVDRMVRLVIGISDALKPESAQTVRALQDAQMQVEKCYVVGTTDFYLQCCFLAAILTRLRQTDRQTNR